MGPGKRGGLCGYNLLTYFDNWLTDYPRFYANSLAEKFTFLLRNITFKVFGAIL